ncbi:MAG: M23 family metallopeptidase [Bacteroidia bacterium]|nr:M23 family metallopeptidase [Bacteroidia bacterium]
MKGLLDKDLRPKITRWQKIKRFLKRPYRFLVINNENIENVGDMTVSSGAIIFFSSLTIFLTFFITAILIVFTPIRELIPGYTNTEMMNKIKEMREKVLDMEVIIAQQDSLIENVKRMANFTAQDSIKAQGNTQTQVTAKPAEKEPPVVTPPAPSSESATPPKAVLASYSAQPKNISDVVISLLPPVDGVLTNSYNEQEQHFGIDIAAQKDALVRAVTAGTIIFSEYSYETGHVIAVAHANNLVSFYKHNSYVFKKAGSYVATGEAIAVLGNSGEQTTGPHLHLELWKDGKPINPLLFLNYSQK